MSISFQLNEYGRESLIDLKKNDNISFNLQCKYATSFLIISQELFQFEFNVQEEIVHPMRD